jgi:hypothetical protein
LEHFDTLALHGTGFVQGRLIICWNEQQGGKETATRTIQSSKKSIHPISVALGSTAPHHILPAIQGTHEKPGLSPHRDSALEDHPSTAKKHK